MMWVDSQVPHWAAFCLNWTLLIGTSLALALYKRRPAGWALFWAMAALPLISAALYATGLSGQDLLIGGLAAATAISSIIYWFIRMPRHRDPVAPPVQIIRHEHVLIGQAGQAAGHWTARPAVAPAPARTVLAGNVVRAITAPQRKADGLLAGLLAAAREAVSGRRQP